MYLILGKIAQTKSELFFSRILPTMVCGLFEVEDGFLRAFNKMGLWEKTDLKIVRLSLRLLGATSPGKEKAHLSWQKWMLWPKLVK